MTNAINGDKTIRDIIEINEELCNGCGKCLSGCAEGALALVDGHIKLISDSYCDGLGACLNKCPTGALKIIQRHSLSFDEEAVMEKQKHNHQSCHQSSIQLVVPVKSTNQEKSTIASGLNNWPIQLRLVSETASFLDHKLLILAADCTAFATFEFHQTFLTLGAPLIMGCPKLDDSNFYIDKLTTILKNHTTIEEIIIPMMTVPCCRGLAYIASQATMKSQRPVKLKPWFITPDGSIKEEKA